MITTLTGKNQITIPAKLARRLELEPGTKVDWTVTEDGALVGRPQVSRRVLANRLRGSWRKHVRAGSDPIAEFVASRLEEDAEEGGQ